VLKQTTSRLPKGDETLDLLSQERQKGKADAGKTTVEQDERKRPATPFTSGPKVDENWHLENQRGGTKIQ